MNEERRQEIAITTLSKIFNEALRKRDFQHACRVALRVHNFDRRHPLFESHAMPLLQKACVLIEKHRQEENSDDKEEDIDEEEEKDRFDDDQLLLMLSGINHSLGLHVWLNGSCLQP